MKKILSTIILFAGIACFQSKTANAQSAGNDGQQGNSHQKKVVIAIYPFTTSASYNYDYAESAGNAVEAGFVRSGRFTVVERSRFGILQDEDRFKEVNTADAVKKAARLGANILVTGHIIAVTTGFDATNPLLPSLKSDIAQISLAFKLINVETGEIVKSETIIGKGKGSTPAEAMIDSYNDIDRLSRAEVAEYLPQRFTYAEAGEIDKKHRLKTFKIWGGSNQGLKKGDILDIYQLSYITDPQGKKIQEKELQGTAKIVEVNSTETATCELQKYNSIGAQLLTDLKEKPETIVFEYQGTVKKKGIFN
ncbi:MAG TPA: CsgG/HfaB family protein [Hanamia sp.]|nr:CsgG/HfaB family protein [Hanamia sp.]